MMINFRAHFIPCYVSVVIGILAINQSMLAPVQGQVVHIRKNKLAAQCNQLHSPPWGHGSMAAWVARTRASRIAWWRKARFGVFIHWDPVSIVGTEISWSRMAPRRGCPISEKGSVPRIVYDNLYKMFNPTRFNPSKWVAIARSAGMRYIVFTAMHCDGFCMFNTRYTNYNIMHTPFGKDICARLAAACHKADMPVGWYYSPMNWYDPEYVLY